MYQICAVGNLRNEVEEFCVHYEPDHTVGSQQGRHHDQRYGHNKQSFGVGEIERVHVLRPISIVLVGALDQDQEQAQENSRHFDGDSDQSAFDDFFLQLNKHMLAVFVVFFLEESSVQYAQ